MLKLKPTLEDLPYEPADLLEEIELVRGKQLEIFAHNAFGDLFLKDETGAVFFLDMAFGTLGKIDCGSSFESWAAVSENEELYFRKLLFDEVLASGMSFEEGQCIGYKVPPMMGGPLALSNLEPTDMLVHVSFISQLKDGLEKLESEKESPSEALSFSQALIQFRFLDYLRYWKWFFVAALVRSGLSVYQGRIPLVALLGGIPVAVLLNYLAYVGFVFVRNAIRNYRLLGRNSLTL